jgi:glycosyltransferase involved in cell wall biosynthesis
LSRICFVICDMSVTGGAERVLASLANKLSEHEEIHIFSITKENDENNAFPLSDRVKIHYSSTGKKRYREILLSGWKPLRAYLKKEKIDIAVAVTGYMVPVVAMATMFMKRIKTVFYDHGALCNQLNDKTAMFQRSFAAKHFDMTVVLTRRSMEDYISRFHMQKDRVTYIYNWIDDALLSQDCEYRPGCKKIISVGRLSPEKGFDMLIQTAKKVLPEHPDWSWDIYGDGDERDAIQKQIYNKHLDGQLILKGNRKDIYRLYSEYAFLVLTSYREGLPLVLLEAKACGLPLVSFDCLTGPSEIISSGEDGYLIPPYDTDEMADKIAQLMECPELRKSFSDNSHKNTEKFSQNVILNQWLELISNLL